MSPSANRKYQPALPDVLNIRSKLIDQHKTVNDSHDSGTALPLNVIITAGPAHLLGI